MCSICKDILIDFTQVHPVSSCPIRNSRYCSYCAKYGHLTSACPAPPSHFMREPAFVEQLIAPSDLKKYNIITLTPLPVYKKEEQQRLLEIKDDDEIISKYLSARSIKTVKPYTKRDMLEEYAKQQNRRLVYIK